MGLVDAFREGMEQEQQAQREALEKRLMKGMTDAGVPPAQAIAMVLAFTFALDSHDFASQYGTFTQDNLREALRKM